MLNGLQINCQSESAFSYAVFFLSPYTLVRIGPSFKTALETLTAGLIEELQRQNYTLIHLATTYSLANIVIVFGRSAGSDGTGVQLQRLRLQNGKVKGFRFSDHKLSRRIEDQLAEIFKHHKNIQTPFRCVEGWRGFNCQQHPIYERMIQAGTSLESWKEFRIALASRPSNKRQVLGDFSAGEKSETIGKLQQPVATKQRHEVNDMSDKDSNDNPDGTKEKRGETYGNHAT